VPNRLPKRVGLRPSPDRILSAVELQELVSGLNGLAVVQQPPPMTQPDSGSLSRPFAEDKAAPPSDDVVFRVSDDVQQNVSLPT